MQDFPCPARGQHEKKEINDMFLTSASPSNTLLTMSEKNILLSLCLLCSSFIGQNQRAVAHFLVFTFIRCFASTIYGWMWLWRGREMGWSTCTLFQVDLGFKKEEAYARFYKPGYFLTHVHFLICTYMLTFSVDSKHSFIHEAPCLSVLSIQSVSM